MVDGLLQSLFGEQYLFVMGEITGVHRSFSISEKAEANAGRRFAGKSWGVYKVIPPVQHFLRTTMSFIPSPLITPSLDREDIFGVLPVNYVFLN
jgi:hypothetical protein